MLERLTLERCQSIDEAIAFLVKTPLTLHSMNITLADNKGNLVVLEKSPTNFILRHPVDRGIFCVNHFLTPEMFAQNNRYVFQYLKNSKRRQHYLADILFHSGAEHSVRKIEEILKDSKSLGSVCQLGQENFFTAFGVILLLKKRENKIYPWSSLQGRIQEI